MTMQSMQYIQFSNFLNINKKTRRRKNLSNLHQQYRHSLKALSIVHLCGKINPSIKQITSDTQNSKEDRKI